MRWRGIVTVVTCLVTGLLAGGAIAWLQQESPAASGTPRPVVAVSPSVPIDPPPSVLPDPDEPALPTDLPTRRARLGSAGFAVSFPAPEQWVRTDSASNEAKWKKPGNPLYTYVLRVEQVFAQRDTVAAIVEERIADLDSAVQDLEVLARTSDSLEFTYLEDGYLRHSFLRWLDLTGSGTAELEISVTGRESDVPGMRALLDVVASGARAG